MILWVSFAHADVVTTAAELDAACRDAQDGDLIQIDSSSGRLSADCVLTAANVTIEPIEGLALAEVGTIELRAAASNATLRHLDFDPGDVGTAFQLNVRGALEVLAEDVHFAPVAGYGVGVESGSITVRGCTADGWPQDGAPIVLAPTTGNSSATIEGCTITGGDGGVAVVTSGSATADVEIIDCLFEDGLSEVNGLGGAVQVYGSGSYVTVTNTTFRNNLANPFGGAIAVDEGGGVFVSGSRFEDNRAVAGADLFVRRGTAVIEDSVSWNAVAQYGAIKADDDAELLLEGVRILEPVASAVSVPDDPMVAGVMAHGHRSLVAEGFMVCGAWADLSSGSGEAVSGLMVWDGDATIRRAVFQSNDSGGHTVLGQAANVELDHLSVLFNTDPQGVTAAGGAGVVVSNSLFWENEQDAGPGIQDGGYNAGRVGPGETGLAIDDPRFAVPYDPTDCRHLPYPADDSPLVDAAAPDSPDPDGSPGDIGAMPAGSGSNADVPDAPDDRAWLSGGCPSQGPAGALLIPLLVLLGRARREGSAATPGT